MRDPAPLSGQRVLHAVQAASTAGRAKVIVREDTAEEGSMGLGQVAREVWWRLGRDKFHRSIRALLAERETVRRRVA